MQDLPEYFELWQESLGWQPSAEQQMGFQRLYGGIVAGNQRLNLTRLTTPEDFWEKHLWDSLRGIRGWLGGDQLYGDLGERARVIDIGTGGGFPGLPVAIATPLWHLTLLDSTRKKIAFLAELGRELGLSVAAVAERAEIVGHQHTHRRRYDLALVRAVGSAPACAEYALPLLRRGGVAVLYRGQWSAADTANLEQILPTLGGRQLWVEPAKTPLTQAVRHYLYILKETETSRDFPRAVGVPAKHPLGSE